MPRSSSTIRIDSITSLWTLVFGLGSWFFAFLPPAPAYYSSSAAAYCLLPTIHCYGEFNHKSRSAGIVCFGADSSMMRQNDSLHDRQPQACSAAPGRKVWLKQSLEIGHTNSVSGINHLRNQYTAPDVVPCHDCYSSLSRNLSHSCDGVVDEIHKHTTHLFRIKRSDGHL